MAASNFDYEEYLKQIIEKDYVLEELDDHSSTFQQIFNSTIAHFANKKQRRDEVIEKRSIAKRELDSYKSVLHTLQERRLKLDEAMKVEKEKTDALLEERDEMIKKYTKITDDLHEKISTIDREFNPDMLQQQISDLKKLEKGIEVDIANLIKHKQVLDCRMTELNNELPSFKELMQVKDELFNQHEELAKRQKELDNINTFIGELTAKLKE